MSPGGKSQGVTFVKIAGRRIATKTVSFGGAKAPRLRFDRTAVGLVRRLQAALSKSLPDGKTVVLTITAPIRQDSKTGLVLESKIRELLATRRAQLKSTIYGNRIQVRVMKGGTSQTSKVVGFVHNPKPDPAVLFDITYFLLGCIGSGKRPPKGDHWLAIDNQDGLFPVETLRQVCLALRARKVFKRLVLAESEDVRVL